MDKQLVAKSSSKDRSKHNGSKHNGRSEEYVEVVSYSSFQTSDSDKVDFQGSHKFYEIQGTDALERKRVDKQKLSGIFNSNQIFALPDIFADRR